MKKWLIVLGAACLIGVMIGIVVLTDSKTLPALYDMRTGETVFFPDGEAKEHFVLREENGRILFMGGQKENGQIFTGNLVVGTQPVCEGEREYYDIALINTEDGTVYPISKFTSSIMIGDTFVFFSHDTVTTPQGEAPRVELVFFR